MNWSVTSRFEEANHEPLIEGPLSINAAAGSAVKLRCKVSDPDQDQLSVHWKQFKVGSYKGDIIFENPANASTSVTIPSDALSGDTIHLVLTATDNQTPSMTRYHRIIITVK